MNKLENLNAVFDGDELSLIDLKVLCVLFENSYLSYDDICKTTDVIFEIDDIKASVDKLKGYKLIDASDDMFVLSLDGDELIEQTAMTWFEMKYPDAKSPHGGKIKRPITDIMTDCRQILYDDVGEFLRDEKIKRQNYKILFTVKGGLKYIEIRNSGFIRIIVGRHEAELVKKLYEVFNQQVTAIVHTDASSIKKFDIELSEENMSIMTNFIKENI